MLYTVEYYVIGSDESRNKVTQKLSQDKLADLLKNQNVDLIGVNREQGAYRRRRRKAN